MGIYLDALNVWEIKERPMLVYLTKPPPRDSKDNTQNPKLEKKKTTTREPLISELLPPKSTNETFLT